MIDLRAARNDPDRFRVALARRGAGEAFDALMEADASWRGVNQRLEETRAEQKKLGKPSSQEEIDRARTLKDQLKTLDEQASAAARERDDLLLRIPNLPHESVPDGDSEEAVQVVRVVGDPPALDAPREHTEIGRFDMERAARVSGARFGYWIGDAALVAFALYRLALDRLVADGFVPVLPPVLVREQTLVATGQLPSLEDNIYALPADDLYLAGTAEIPLGGLHMGEIVDAEDLPLRYAGFSPCFRREAGAAGKDTRGMFRVHQFNKVEQFSYTRPEESWDELERLLANTEGIVQELGVPYRIVVLPAGDFGNAMAKTYDVEMWFPTQERYRETASVSNATDFQARRLDVRYRGDHGPAHVHTLNGTAAVDRMALAVLENFQGDVPEALQQFGAPARVER